MPFEPSAHPGLAGLGQRLRELAGDAAFKAGRDYLRTGNVKDGAVAPTAAEPAAVATVSGSTDYRVTVRFPATAESRVTCTCPAHRRSKFCKHVVAVCAALLEQPGSFSVLESVPEPPAPATRRGRKAPAPRGERAANSEPAAQRAAGLEVLDRLLLELTEGGLMQLGADKASLIAQCAELVRALKLRRLGNLLGQLQRAVTDPRALDGQQFSQLLLDLYRCRVATGAQLAGSVALDQRIAEDLVGKTWRAEELEQVSGLELVQLAAHQEIDGEFLVATSYLADLASGDIYADRLIAPRRLRSNQPPQHRVRVLVDAAGLYPGLPPRRIRLGSVRRAPLLNEHIDQLIMRAPADVSDLQRRLLELVAVPFGQPKAAVLFRPSALLQPPGDPGGAPTSQAQPAGALDDAGRFLALDWAPLSRHGLALAPPTADPYALFGLLSLTAEGLLLRPFSLIGVGPRSSARNSFGRIFPGDGVPAQGSR
jgi:hypothetical protein